MPAIFSQVRMYDAKVSTPDDDITELFDDL